MNDRDKKTNRKKIHVMLIGPVAPPIGGMATYFQGLRDSEVSSAFNVITIASNRFNKFAYAGIFRQVMNFMNTIALTLAVIAKLLTFHPRIVHIQTNSGPGFFERSLVAFFARIFRSKVFMHVHGGGFRDFYYRSSCLVKWIIRQCVAINHYIIVASPTMEETFQIIGTPAEKIKLLRNAVLIPPKTIWDQDHDGDSLHNETAPVTVLFLNRVSIAKGALDLIDAAEKICRNFPKVKFCVVGSESPDTEIIKQRVSDADCCKQFKFVGPVPENEKQKYFLSSDIYILPSHLEDLPYGLMEAMSYAIPCIASSVGGIPHLLENGMCGLLVNPAQPQNIVDSLSTLITDTSLRKNMGLMARERIQQEFSWEYRGKEIVDFYHKALNGR